MEILSMNEYDRKFSNEEEFKAIMDTLNRNMTV